MYRPRQHMSVCHLVLEVSQHEGCSTASDTGHIGAHNKIKGAGSSSEAGQATQNRGKLLYHTARNVHPDVCMELGLKCCSFL